MNPSLVQTNDRGWCILIRSVIAGMYLKLVGNWIRTDEDSWNWELFGMEGGNTVEEKHFMVGSDLASDGRPRRQDQVMRRTYPPIPP
jgi:hypothetical protein